LCRSAGELTLHENVVAGESAVGGRAHGADVGSASGAQTRYGVAVDAAAASLSTRRVEVKPGATGDTLLTLTFGDREVADIAAMHAGCHPPILPAPHAECSTAAVARKAVCSAVGDTR